MAKTKAKGVLVKMALTATPTTNYAQNAEVSFSQGDRTLVDVTTLDSVTTKEYLDSGLRDTCELDITSEYDPADTIHELARAAHAAGTLVFVTLVLPDAGAAQWAMSGIILSFGVPTLQSNGSLKNTIRFKATGVDTFAA